MNAAEWACNPNPDMNRRGMLKTIAAAGLSAALPWDAVGQDRPSWQSSVLTYLESLRRSDGGYAWDDQPAGHLTPTFAAIGCYHALQGAPPNKTKLTEFVRSHHPFHIKKLERELRVFEFQQIQGLLWLGSDAKEFREQVRGWRKPSAYPTQYEQHGYPVFQYEMMAFICRALLELPLDDLTPELIDYLKVRRRANGSFNNTPATDGADGHVMNTWWGLQALHTLGRGKENQEQTIAWLQACQLPNGGFTYQPKPEFGGVDDVVYTWAAVRALQQLGAAPTKRDACIRYLHSLWNGIGFAPRPTWPSNPIATYYALDALRALDAVQASTLAPKPAPKRNTAQAADLKVFTIQIEAHGQGSPAEAVDLARALRIHLWGAKNAKPAWTTRAQAIADQQNVPVKFFIANEEYGTWVNVPGLGTYSHTSDIIAPAGASFGASLATKGVVSWPEFRKQRLAPLQQADGRLVWQFGENEELTRIYLDDSLQRGGYAAISTFHFGNPDFTNSEPFLKQYRMQIPFVALQDGHGNEPWWFADMTTGMRTLFLAREATWESWLTALRQNWVVAVRHDAVSGFKSWMHGGAPEVLDLIRQRARDWQWWDNPEIQRPLVSLVAVRPEDEFETARPEKGVTLRVRCAWENTTQGQPKKALAELVKLTVDDRVVTPTLVEKKRPRGAGLDDHYHQLPLTNLTSGNHTATVTVRLVGSKAEVSRTITFKT